ncbi:TetR/AcrR family transcriptional regulator [Mycobacterium sp. M1]|uniref:TetR/AcrR family transcriptional regulator n=1 Tax=Mycolicibacter acidiphilus TaxID=2835306 RepID=A0ABS5RKD3_9MYCO|nr:TetR/AcrR family transcriptional regulator [Mycolicibacter acidiphilus]MBS9534763.1 TetR/AcrR family transcriptional regulator [Mycolicibacter acidiphilus]
MGPRSGTKTKMLGGAIELLRERGAAGVTVDAVLSRTKSPRGSVYHHFPGGRDQIMTESLALAGDVIGAVVEGVTAEGSVAALHRLREFWATTLRDSDFRAGCPVVSVAVGGSTADEHLLPAVAEIFARWHRVIAHQLVIEGVPRHRADRLATLAVAAIEGVLILCRAQRSTAPLDDVIAEFEVLFGPAAG